MVTGSTLVRVVPRPGGGWDVREPGGNPPLIHADSQAKAVKRAHSMLSRGGDVQVLDAGGFSSLPTGSKHRASASSPGGTAAFGGSL
jgi:Uncharacterized protein conserved in bacteria (DUF2188)